MQDRKGKRHTGPEGGDLPLGELPVPQGEEGTTDPNPRQCNETQRKVQLPPEKATESSPAASEEISRIDTETGKPLSEATQVAEGVVKFYQQWFSQRSAPTHRWKTEEDMMHLRTSNLNDPAYTEFVETAYRESYDKFNLLQQEEGIWNQCCTPVTMEELIQTVKSAKAATAGGPSGLTYDILKDADTTHLAPLLEILQS